MRAPPPPPVARTSGTTAECARIMCASTYPSVLNVLPHSVHSHSDARDSRFDPSCTQASATRRRAACMHARTHTSTHASKHREQPHAPRMMHTLHTHTCRESTSCSGSRGHPGASAAPDAASSGATTCGGRARACVRATMQRASPPCVHVHLQRYYARASTPPANNHRWHRTAATKAAAAVAVAGVAAAAATCQGPPGQIMLKRPRPKKYGLTMVSRVV